MKGLASLFLGIFGTFAFSWVGLTVIPNWQIGHLNPQSDEEGTDIYPMPQSGMVARGARVYAANGCIYCHSQQVRADYAADDIERKCVWVRTLQTSGRAHQRNRRVRYRSELQLLQPRPPSRVGRLYRVPLRVARVQVLLHQAPVRPRQRVLVQRRRQ